MDRRPTPPDADDAVTERAVAMGDRPTSADRGAGRAIHAAFSRNRLASAAPGKPGDDGQEDSIEGPGYPAEDMDDLEDDEDDESDPEGLETGDGMLEELMVPPGGDALGGDRDADPNLNGGHGISMQAPEEGPVPIEDEPTDLSIIGHGHEDKAAWNRERVAHLQEIEDDEAPARETATGSGLGGAAVAGVAEGFEGGLASPTLDQGDDAFDAELSEEEEILGDIALDDLPGDLREDATIMDPDDGPMLPEHRELPEDDLLLEERLVATPGEDPLVAGAEFGTVEDLEAEDSNMTDDISRDFEDQRDSLSDSMDGNERRGGVEDR